MKGFEQFIYPSSELMKKMWIYETIILSWPDLKILIRY